MGFEYTAREAIRSRLGRWFVGAAVLVAAAMELAKRATRNQLRENR